MGAFPIQGLGLSPVEIQIHRPGTPSLSFVQMTWCETLVQGDGTLMGPVPEEGDAAGVGGGEEVTSVARRRGEAQGQDGPPPAAAPGPDAAPTPTSTRGRYMTR